MCASMTVTPRCAKRGLPRRRASSSSLSPDPLEPEQLAPSRRSRPLSTSCERRPHAGCRPPCASPRTPARGRRCACTSTMKVGSSQRDRYFLTVMSSFMPSIWKAPSPMVQTTVRSGYANLAATAYGIAREHARQPPGQVAAHPVAAAGCGARTSRRVVPASAVTIAPCGQPLVQLVEDPPRVHRRRRRSASPALHLLLPVAHLVGDPSPARRGPSSARAGAAAPVSVVFTSPHRLTSVGYRRPSCSGWRSICTARACPVAGRNSPVRVVRAEQHERVALLHLLVARPRARAVPAAGCGTARRRGRRPCRAAP